MEKVMISKKELLEITGISYGQLYRWKRKNLIPEEWFVKKSSFTGQETYFPKAKILARIEKILGMKEDLSLADLAEVFSPDVSQIKYKREQILERNIVSDYSLNFYEEINGKISEYDFQSLLIAFILHKLLSSGDVSLEEAKAVCILSREAIEKSAETQWTIFVTRKLGVTSVIVIESGAKTIFEENLKITVKLELSSCVEELKITLS